MYDLQIQEAFSLAGKSFSLQQTISTPNMFGMEDLLPIAWDSALTTRTSGTAGELTMVSSGHLITTGATIDLYWTDANGNQQIAYGALVGTVAGVLVPFTGAEGTALPAAATDIFAAVVTSYTISTPIVGNDVATILAAADFAAASIVLLDAVPSVDLAIGTILGGCYSWLGAGVNPIAGKTVTTVHMSHSDIATPHNVRLSVQLNS
jgi:hypothetical protein